MNFKNWLSKNYPFVFIFLFFTYINFLSPPVGDDWEISRWLSVNSSGDIIMSLKDVYWNWKYFNGRGLSNFLMSFFCYHKFIWNFASAGIITYIIFAFSKLFNFKKNVNALLLLILLLLSVSDGIRVEVYSQICSNIAYMIPIVSILYFLLKFKKVFNQREQVYSKTTLITTIIICIFISTLMENVSAGFTATLAIFNLYFFIKNKKINKLLFISLLSSLVGSIFMFTSPGIRLSRELYNHSLGIVSTFKNSLFSNISLIIFQNKFIFLIITLITIVAINTNSINIKHKLIKYLYLSFVFLILFILSVSVVNNYIFIPQKIMSLTYYFFSRRFLVSFFWLTFLLSFIIPVLYIIRNKKIFLFLLSVAIFSLIPASLITQTGARIIAIIVFIMIGISSGFYSKIESNKLTFWLICFGIIVQSNKLLTIYHDIYKTQKIRQNVNR